MSGNYFSSLGRSEEESERIDQDIFVATEFAKMESTSRLQRQQHAVEEVDPHPVAAYHQMKDDFENFDDDFFDDADTTLDYGKKGNTKGSTKKAKGIEIQWTEVDF